MYINKQDTMEDNIMADTTTIMEVIMGVMLGGTTAAFMVFMMDSIMMDIMVEDTLQCT